MLELVHNDPRGWLRNYCKKNRTPSRAPAGTGYIYVIALTGPMSYIKIGSTAQPRTRLETLCSEATRFEAALTWVWLSPAHPTYRISEACALKACRALSPAATPRSEYFPSLSFVVARREAVKAVLGIHSTPHVSTTTRAVGLHERLPAHVQAQASTAQLRRMEYFARGSYRTRFLRRGNPTPQPRPEESDLLHTYLLRQLRLPSAGVIDLSARRAAAASAG